MAFCGTLEAFIDDDWVDITDYADVGHGDGARAACGRQTILEEANGSQLSITLRDWDRRFMPGSPESPYGDWDQGTPIRWYEVISATTVWYFNGYVEDIETVLITDEDDPGTTEQWALVRAIDRVTLLDAGTAFVSTLAAYIRSNPTSVTQYAYWPLLDSDSPFQPVIPYQPTLTDYYPMLPAITATQPRAIDTKAAVVPAGGSTLPGDDAPGVYLRMGVNGSSSADSPTLGVGFTGAVGGIVPAGNTALFQNAALMFWLNAELPFDEQVTILTYTLRWGVSATATIVLRRLIASSNSVFEVGVSGSISGTVTTTLAMATSRAHMISILVTPGNASSSVALKIDDQSFSGTIGGFGGAVTGVACHSIVFGGKLQGTISHLQAYAATLSAAELAAQRQVGLTGLERQTVTERITSLCDFAAVDSSLLSIEDTGTTMQGARLAGVRPGAAIRAAAATDQGVWFGDPEGLCTFQSRRHRYYDASDTPVEIPYEWLAAPLNARRDPPFTSATVTQENGAVGRAGGLTSVDRSFTATLQTSCDADPTVLASFMTGQYASPQTSVRQVEINLDARADSEALILLQISIGDLVEITDPPAGWTPGMALMSVEGRAVVVTTEKTVLLLTGSPVLGSVSGSGDTWFVLGTSALGGTDVMPF